MLSCLIPHRHLHDFPIHALPVSDKYLESKSLLELFPKGIKYLPNGQFMPNTSNHVLQDLTNLFAIQNPLSSMPFTDLEVESIRTFFPHSTILARDAATKAAVMNSEKLSSAHHLHFSGHGSMFNFESPLDSAILLAGFKANSDATDTGTRNTNPSFDLTNALTVDEISKLNLSECRLVTLSACETGLIDTSSYSDECMSFQSAFLRGGAKYVIGSLWTINDTSTAILMIKFYQNLSEGLTISSALAQAQIWLKNLTNIEFKQWIEKLSIRDVYLDSLQKKFIRLVDENEQPFADPYYWAAFTVTGWLE